MKACEIDPAPFMSQCDALVPFQVTNRSASSHLSRVKEDYEYMMAIGHFDINLAEQQEFMNHHITQYITSFHKNDYDRPRQRFHHELILRRWV